MSAGPTEPDDGRTGQREPGRALLLLNPHSRSGVGEAAEWAIGRLEAGGLILVRRHLSGKDDVTHEIQSLVGAIDAVIVGGGDGSVNAVLEGVMQARLPLGILPLGTANDLARTLGLPSDPLAAADVILAGRTRRIDVGRVNGRLFLNVASLGLSVEITRGLTAPLKRRWGRLGYPIATAHALLRARPFTADVRSGPLCESMQTLQIAVGNGVYYGGGMVVYEAAQIDDGCLDFYSLEPRGFWRLLSLLPFLRRGRQRGMAGVRAFCCNHPIEIQTDRPLPINTDGEITTTTPARFAILPRALEVFASRSVTQPAARDVPAAQTLDGVAKESPTRRPRPIRNGLHTFPGGRTDEALPDAGRLALVAALPGLVPRLTGLKVGPIAKSAASEPPPWQPGSCCPGGRGGRAPYRPGPDHRDRGPCNRSARIRGRLLLLPSGLITSS